MRVCLSLRSSKKHKCAVDKEEILTFVVFACSLLLTASCRRTQAAVRCRAAASLQRQRLGAHQYVTCTYPEPETEKERSSVDFPQVILLHSKPAPSAARASFRPFLECPRSEACE